MVESSSDLKTNIVEPLPHQKRKRLFLSLLTIFLCAVPIFVFYATGYRYNIFDNQNGVTATGGMYIGVSQNEGDIFVNDEPARGSRIFRRATYIQSVTPGVHRVHVQGEGLQTWVKDLPVFPHMVTEAEAFLLPERPIVRLISASSTATSSVLLPDSVVDNIDTIADNVLINSPYQLVSDLSPTEQTVDNPEFAVLTNLFFPTQNDGSATTTEESVGLIPDPPFRFVSDLSSTTSTTSVSLTRVQGDIKLYLKDNALFAEYIGSARSVPHYFCVPTAAAASTTELYGAHVAYGIDTARVIQTSIQPTISETMPGDTRICRSEIRLDTKFQEIIDFNFFPGSTDLVIVQRADGVYVVEIDDRAWQNVQTLFPLPVDALLVDNNRIFVAVADIFIEIDTDLPNN